MQEEDEATAFCLAAFEAISSGVSARTRATGASPVALSGFNLYGLQSYGITAMGYGYGYGPTAYVTSSMLITTDYSQ